MSFFDGLDRFVKDLQKKLKPEEVVRLRSCKNCPYYKRGYCTQTSPPTKILSEYYAQGCIYYGAEQPLTGLMTKEERESYKSLLDRIKLIDQVSLIDLITKVGEITTIKTLETLSEITNVTSVDLIDLITKITEITTIKAIETIGSMPDTTPRGSEGIAFKQVLGSGGDWVSPTGHEDPDNVWSQETFAYDDDLREWYSYAYTSFPRETWGKFLVLTHSAITCNKLRLLLYYYSFECKPSIIDIDVYDGTWHHVYEGEISAWVEWIEYPFSERSITKMRIRFYANYIPCPNCQPWIVEADFWEVPTIGGELFSSLCGWTGSAWQKVRCDGEGYLLTKTAP